MASKRKAISKKTRFEVFKRDGFACQYCGKCAPDVVLHIDHMNPVSKGGDNNILNLITSCADCNGGKSDRLLDEHAVLAKQREQLAQLTERREQLKMMSDWRMALLKLGDEELALFVAEVEARLGGVTLLDHARSQLRAFLRKHGYQSAIKSVETGIDRHVKFVGGDPTDASIGLMLRCLDSIASYSQLPTEIQDAHYCRGILKNRFPDDVYFGGDEWDECMGLLSRALAFAPGEQIRQMCKKAPDYYEWWDEIMALVGREESRADA